ncbi:hypothetical protein BJV74DRAFT_887700 [Russula compacta]|nr:hypothetical protein BJV74DRAFT_887700 [Russula compacta]
MAIGKAAKWISFATPQQTPSSSSVAHDTIHTTISIADEKQFGLENFGNTCYANSVLQALYFCSPFRDLVIQSTDNSAPPVPAPLSLSRQTPPPLLTATSVLPRRKSERGKAAPDIPSAPPTPTLVIPSAPPTLFSALRSLYVYISRNSADKGAVAPRAFIDKLRDGNELFRGVMHQDAHEFLNYLLNKIVEEIQFDKHHKENGKDASNTSGDDSSSGPTMVSSTAPTLTTHPEFTHQSSTLVHRLFEGTLTSETRCLTCETVSSRDESFLDLSIDIEQNSSVTACLRQFSASEMLCQRNKFFCDSCCGLQEAEKRMKIKKLPNILALHLKRFKYQEELRKYIKLTYRVAFPFELRLFNTIDDVEDPDRLYELFGIVVHIGSGPHHGHYVAIVKGPHSWLIFDDDKIEPIKESEIPRFFGDAASGSAYVLYYQAVDLDLASLGIKEPALPTVPDITVVGSPASTTNTTTTTGGSSLENQELTLPPGLGDSFAPPPATASIPHLPIPTAPSSPSLVTTPLAGSSTLPTRKKSLPSIRIPGTSESSAASPTSTGRTHGGLFHTLRSSPSSSKIRPSTSEGVVSLRSAPEDVPPVPPVPPRYIDGKEPKEKEREKDKGSEKEREEERSSKEFDRRPSLWFRRRNPKPTKDDREKEKEKDTKGKDKDVSSAPVHTTAATPSHAPAASALSAVPSQSDAGSSVSGASSLWRRGSARMGYHVKRLSATYSATALGDADAAAGSSGSTPSHPHPHHYHHQEPPGQLPSVPVTPQSIQPEREPSTPSSTSSSPAHQPTLALHLPAPPADGLLPPPASAGIPGSSSLPAWRISPASPPGASNSSPSTTPAAPPPHHHRPSKHTPDNNNNNDEGDASDDRDDHEQQHLRARIALLARRRRGRRPHSVHGGGSGSGTPRDRSASPREEAAAAATARAAAPPLPPDNDGSHPSVIANGVPSPSTSSTSASNSKGAAGTGTGKEPAAAGLRRAARKLSLNAPMFGLGLGLGLGFGLGGGSGGSGGGRDRDRDHNHLHHHHDQHQRQHPQHHHQNDDHHLGSKKEDGNGKKAHNKFRPPSSSLFGSGSSSSAALASAVP